MKAAASSPPPAPPYASPQVDPEKVGTTSFTQGQFICPYTRPENQALWVRGWLREWGATMDAVRKGSYDDYSRRERAMYLYRKSMEAARADKPDKPGNVPEMIEPPPPP